MEEVVVHMRTNKRVEQMSKVQTEALDLFKKKNQDYGDAFAKYGPVGVLLRMNDKVSRLQSISKSGVVLVNDEKMRDTLIDLHNYSAMAVMLLDEGGELKYPENDIFVDNDPVENISDKLTFYTSSLSSYKYLSIAAASAGAVLYFSLPFVKGYLQYKRG